MTKTENLPTRLEALHELILRGDVAGARDCIQRVPMNRRSKALGLAARYAGVDMVSMLLRAGASLAYSRTATATRLVGIVPSSRNNDGYFWQAGERYLYFLTQQDSNTLCRLDERHPRVTGAEYDAVLRLMVQEGYGAGFRGPDMLYFAVLYEDVAAIAALARCGIRTLGGDVKRVVCGAPGAAASPAARVFRTAVAAEAQTDPDILRRMSEYAGQPVDIRPVDIEGSPSDEMLLAMLKYTKYADHVAKRSILLDAAARGSVEAVAWGLSHGWARTSADYDALIEAARAAEAPTELVALILEDQGRSGKHRKTSGNALATDPNSAAFLRRTWSARVLPDNTLEVTSYKGNPDEVHDVVIPARIGKRKVTGVNPDAFSVYNAATPKIRKARRAVRSVFVPGTVQTIPAGILANHEALREVHLDDGVSDIAERAFSGCTGLREITLPTSLRSIQNAAFAGCESLETVHGDLANVSAAPGAFRDCARLAQRKELMSHDGCTVWLGRIIGGHFDVMPPQLQVQARSVDSWALPLLPIMVYSDAEIQESPSPIGDVQYLDKVHFGMFPLGSTNYYVRPGPAIDLALRPLQWQCIRRKKHRALLITTNIIAAIPQHWVDDFEIGGDMLSSWLSTGFIECAFRPAERACILPTHSADDSGRPGAWLPTRKIAKKCMNERAMRLPTSTAYATCQRRCAGRPGGQWRDAWLLGDVEAGRAQVAIGESYIGPLDPDPCPDADPSIEALNWWHRNIGLRPCIWVRV